MGTFKIVRHHHGVTKRCLGRPIAPSYMNPNAGEVEGDYRVSANEYICAHGAQKNFGDVTAYLTYGHNQ